MNKLIISINLLITLSHVFAADSYNSKNGLLIIPTVLVEDKLYSNVLVSISGVLAVNCGAAANNCDTFNIANGQLNNPAVFSETTLYNNVGAYQFINIPLHYNPKTDFAQNITVNDRNNSMLMRTWAGNDIFYDTNANAKLTKIDGGLGTNKVIYSGSSAQYSVSRNTNGTTSVVSSSSAPIQINDTLTNIQQIQFIDKTIALN